MAIFEEIGSTICVRDRIGALSNLSLIKLDQNQVMTYSSTFKRKRQHDIDQNIVGITTKQRNEK